jgi:hypothetical protein
MGLTNSNPFNMLAHWACYLGFAWTHQRRGREVFMPDPTAYVRHHLPDLFKGERGVRVPLKDAMARLAERCPVFEGGILRDRVERELAGGVRQREANQLSSTTALAWLRLEEEGYVKLSPGADDPNLRLLPDGKGHRRVALVERLGAKKEGGGNGV